MSELPQPGQRWLKRGTRTSVVTVQDVFEAGPWVPDSVFASPIDALPVLLPLAEFLETYVGPLPEPERHDPREAQVSLGHEHRLRVSVEGRSANRRLTLHEEQEDGGQWHHYEYHASLELTPDQGRALAEALQQVLRRKGEA